MRRSQASSSSRFVCPIDCHASSIAAIAARAKQEFDWLVLGRRLEAWLVGI